MLLNPGYLTKPAANKHGVGHADVAKGAEINLESVGLGFLSDADAMRKAMQQWNPPAQADEINNQAVLTAVGENGDNNHLIHLTAPNTKKWILSLHTHVRRTRWIPLDAHRSQTFQIEKPNQKQKGCLG